MNPHTTSPNNSQKYTDPRISHCSSQFLLPHEYQIGEEVKHGLPTPIPYANTNPNPYGLPGLMGTMANELGNCGVDPTIVAAQIVGFVSLVTQGTADVLWPNKQRAPVGTNVLLVAPSGGGKSVIFKTLMEPITRSLSEHRNTHSHNQLCPAFFIEDATRESTLLHLSEWPIAGLFTDEAGMLKKLLKGGASTLAKLLDGTALHHSRVSTGRISLEGHRFNMLLLEQPQVFQETKALLGASTGSVGLINRFQIFMASDLPVGASMHRLGLTTLTAQRYEEKNQNLLNTSIENVLKGQERPTFQLAPQALEYFCNLREEVQQRLQRDSRLTCIAEYASRHSERALRLAACIHAFEHDNEPEIPLSTIQCADNFDHKSIESYLKMTYAPPKLTQAEQNAQLIYDELLKVVYAVGKTEHLLSDLRKLAPNIGLTKAQFDRALPLLARKGSVSILTKRGGEVLLVNSRTPAFDSYQHIT